MPSVPREAKATLAARAELLSDKSVLSAGMALRASGPMIRKPRRASLGSRLNQLEL